MNIGFVSTWFERGAAYVTKNYIKLLEEKHNIFVYARGGEKKAKNDPNWDLPNVTWGLDLPGSHINFNHIKKWIKKNNIDLIFFNEQKPIKIVYEIKKAFPKIKLGSYIDYYKENTVNEFYLYDFLICNTKRHYSVFKNHPQSYYIPWGTDTNLFRPYSKNDDQFTFFHSTGMSNRKGTTFVIEAFITGKIYKKAKLIIHTQRDLKETFGYDIEDLENYNIEVIEKTVTAPGLYYLGDVYVYPTMLDGLGLTMYEALSSGLPVITTNHPPMNEVINQEVGYLVDVDHLRSRSDGYYWPLSIVDINSLIDAMQYFITNKNNITSMQNKARQEAVEKWEWEDRKKEIQDIFQNTQIIVKEPYNELLVEKNKLKIIKQKVASSYIYHLLNKIRK